MNFLCVIKNLIYSPSNFQICNIIVNHTVTIISPELSYLTSGSLYLWPPSFISLTPHSPLVTTNLLCLYEFKFCFFFKIPHINEIIQYVSLSVWPISVIAANLTLNTLKSKFLRIFQVLLPLFIGYCSIVCVCVNCLVVSNSLQPHRLQTTRPLHPWDSPGKNTRVGCHFLFQQELWKEKVKLLSHVRLCDPMDCSPPGSSIHRIFQARVLEWVAISFSDCSINIL